jgi:type I restriction enzyme S subunit
MEERELPEGWTRCLLGDVVDYGKTHKAEPSTIPDQAWVLELEDIEKDSSRLIERLSFAERKSKSTKNFFNTGDVLYGKLRPYLNKVIIADRQGFCSTEIIPLPPGEALEAGYLFYWLKSPEFLAYTSEVSHGINMPRLGTEAGRNAPFVLAPLNEQHRIAANLDTTIAAVEACRQRLDGVAAILKRFRQAVLAAATSGELTREWREERGAGDWTVEKAADVCVKVQSGGTPKEGFIDEPGVPFLKVYNLVHQEVDFGYRPQFVRPEVHLGPLSKSRVMPGDVLMNIVGPPLGKVAIVPDVYDEWNINQAITLFRPSELIKGAWIYILLCEGASIREIQLQTKGSAGQVNISLTQCREFEFPVPSTDEQDEIAGHLCRHRGERSLLGLQPPAR